MDTCGTPVRKGGPVRKAKGRAGVGGDLYGLLAAGHQLEIAALEAAKREADDAVRQSLNGMAAAYRRANAEAYRLVRDTFG